ncbi:T9SS type A sorting domain-containing protein [Winogradskyella sp.]|uniref:T9SS type A sorting domain-containing protein n=1 Tax=Winogradskyella sp. TaxID=1883156 RepID=UPI003BAA5A87
MKNNTLILFCLAVLLPFFSTAQTTAIPDMIFEDYLETHSADGSEVALGDANSMGDGVMNGLVETGRINGVTLLDVGNLGISNLMGIQDFTALETLICSENNLTDLDVSNNAALVSLLCGSNSILNLELDSNPNLETLNCSDNQIQILDVTNNIALTSLIASGNQLQNINLVNNTDLNRLSVSDNRITGEFIVSNNTSLESLFCASNQITILDLTVNTLLKNLDASDNALTSLDLSFMNSVECPEPQTDPVTACQDVSSINVSRNQLNSLTVANGFNELIAVFDASDNPDLFCIQIDNGFTPNGWIKDDWTYYSDGVCVDIFTYVPDDNFEQALIDLGYDDNLDNLVLTGNIDTIVNLDISNASILSLIGIEDFTALEVLSCGNNVIESVDLSNNTVLQEINLSDNDLEALNLNANPALVTLDCSGNSISALDLSSNAALTALNCSNNALTYMDVSNNLQLSVLDCSANQIERIDVISNTALVSLFCNDNNLFALNINNGNNNLITDFDATNNPNLFCIAVDDVAFADGAPGWQKDVMASYALNCGTYVPDDNFEQALIDQGIDSDGTLNNFVPTGDINTITILDVSSLAIEDLTGIEDFVALQDLNCSNNSLSALDLSNNTALGILDCSINQIEDLDLTANVALTSLLCSNNALETLNIENGNNAALVVFNSIDNPNLFCINVDDAIVANIPASWQKDDFTVYDGDCINNRITLIPDALFEQALIDLGLDDVINGQVLTANIEHLQTLDVSDDGISNLTGILDFKSLVELDCSGNFLDELDVSNMLFLERLNCSSNYLLTNDVNAVEGVFNTTGTVSLVELYCAGNSLGDLDTSQNTDLEILDCADNDLDTLNISGNTALRELNCSNNDLTDLDISSNLILEGVNCDSNALNNLVTSNVNNTTLTNISCANNNLANLLVNNYEGLVRLNASSNELTQIDITNNMVLEFLSITGNQVSDLNLVNNTNLVEALLSQNNLTALDVSTNTLLEFLNCEFNDITALDLSVNTLLKSLKCSSNQLTELNLADNSALIEVDASSNMLTTINLSNDLSTLKTLNLSNNQLEDGLDLTTLAVAACTFQANQTEFCPETISVNLSNNLFSFVNVQNGINQDIANFNASANPNLGCIQVDDANNVPSNWIKDEATTYNEDCNFGETFVPDDNFEQTLIDLGLDVGPLNDYVLTANIEGLVSLDIGGNAIADLTGIEDFLALESFNCSDNAILEVDLSSNINLLSINCSNNQLMNLDVSSNTALIALNCSDNLISSLDLSANGNLTDLNIASNNFTVFSPSDLLSLQNLNCQDNAIVELDFQQNQSLTSIDCQSNLLELLNIKNGQNALLSTLNAQNNPELTCIETDTGTVPAGATWTIDATAQFAIECFFGETFVPDDNFEQALIDLGYDSGPLDDYVFTENIEAIGFLNLSSRDISDLTGIEDFISLANLDIEGNSIENLDLSSNTLISNLDASDNLITTIDISVLPNLTTLDLSNNTISQLLLNTNTDLINLNVSNNSITSLEVSTLFNLEDFNCAFNELSSLDLTQNPNLVILFCQSNMLVGDQLNIQNGNNENLQIFNATNNPGLGCILVDDPIAVINNEDGTYDNWVKDNSASYQIICEDADNDGVPNSEDLCPGTEFGATVDLFGCAVIDLPSDNFMITITGETCLNSNNGKIRIVAEELYNYTVSLFSEDFIEPTGEDFYQEYDFTNDVDIFNLLAGEYDMCITIEEWPDYESCYTIVITEPNPLEVFASRIVATNQVSVDMSGSTLYHVEFNGELFTTHNSSIQFDLKEGENTIKVSTDLECQGVFEKRLFYGGQFLVYPNPFNNAFYVYNGIENDDIVLELYSSFGQLVSTKKLENRGLKMPVDTSDLPTGIYLLKVKTKTNASIHKIIKR